MARVGSSRSLGDHSSALLSTRCTPLLWASGGALVALTGWFAVLAVWRSGFAWLHIVGMSLSAGVCTCVGLGLASLARVRTDGDVLHVVQMWRRRHIPLHATCKVDTLRCLNLGPAAFPLVTVTYRDAAGAARRIRFVAAYLPKWWERDVHPTVTLLRSRICPE